MKLFVVLALVAFAGCQANVLRSEEPTPQLDMVKDAFWDYYFKATNTVHNALKTIRDSEFGQRVNDKIKDSVEAVRQYTAIMQDQVSVFVRESYLQVSMKVLWLSERLQQDLKPVRAKLEPYTEQLWANIEQQVKKLKKEVAPYTESMESLKATLRRNFEQLIKTVESTVTELESRLGPSSKELQEAIWLRQLEFLESVTPLADSILTKISQRAHDLEQALTPYVVDLEKKLDPYTKDVKSKLTSLWETFTKSA